MYAKTYLFPLLIFSLQTSSEAAANLRQLKILGFYQALPGASNPKMSACVAGMQIAIDVANRHPDILPGYFVEGFFKDEGDFGSATPRAYIDYIENVTNKAPAVVGPYFTCQAISTIVQTQHMIQYAIGCGSSLFTANRKRFPNLFRRSAPVENYIVSLYAVVSVIGKWKRIGLIHSLENSNEFANALAYYNKLTAVGIEVAWFFSAMDIDDRMIDSLKTSNVRIIATTFTSPQTLANFFCITYEQGIRAPYYTFIAYAFAMFDPANIVSKHNCSQGILMQQSEITLFYGTMDMPANRTSGTSDRLYDFQRNFDNLTNHSRPGDFSRRTQCNAAMSQALSSLSKADRTLRASYNLTLSDYAAFPEIIENVLNQSSVTMQILDFGWAFDYSKRLELEPIEQQVFQWVNGHFEMIAMCLPTDTDYNFSAYSHVVLKEPHWQTFHSKPPKDLSEILAVYDTVPKGMLWSAVGSVAFTVFVEVAVACWRFSNCGSTPFNLTNPPKLANALFLTGILFGNAAVLAHVSESPGGLSVELCCLMELLLLLSICLIVAALCIQTVFLFGRKKYKIIPVYVDESAVEDSQPVALQRFHVHDNGEGKTIQAHIAVTQHRRVTIRQIITDMSTYLCCVFVSLTTWFCRVYDEITVTTYSLPLAFDQTLDAYVNYYVQRCHSKRYARWAILSSAELFLVFSCFMAMTRRKRTATAGKTERLTTKVALCYAAITLLGILLLSAEDSELNTASKRFDTGVSAFGMFALVNGTAAIKHFRTLRGIFRRFRAKVGIVV